MPHCAELIGSGIMAFLSQQHVFLVSLFLLQVKHIKASLLRSERGATSALREGQEGLPSHSSIAPLPCYPSDPSRSFLLLLQLFLLCPQLKGINFYWEQPMRHISIIRGSEASCYSFPTSLPTRIKSAQEVLTFLPCREATKPHIQGKEYDGRGKWQATRHLDLNIWGVSDFWVVRCHCVQG